ncbi:sensor histidine kinase [Floridanema evergladense]
MPLPKYTRNHPLQFLVYLEWILLIVLLVSEIQPIGVYQLPRVVWLNFLGIVIFTLLGWFAPTRLWQRFLYTTLEFILILLISLSGGIRLIAILFIVLIIRSCFIFSPRTCLTITGISLFLVCAIQVYRFQFLTGIPLMRNPDQMKLFWLGSIVLIGLILVFLQLLMYAVLSERQSREQLAQAHAKLREYALEIENLATVQERNRIAREIHDSLGHSLTAFNLHLEAALRLLESDPEEARELLVEAKLLGSNALRDVRQSVATLRSDLLKDRSLDVALTELMQNFHRTTNITPNFTYQVNFSLSTPIKIAVYRIVQEALTNICKYAAASEVNISIQADKMLKVIIQDNGKGFDTEKTTSGFGLQGMRERTLALNGNFTLTTAPLAGCRIEAIFPLNFSSAL